MCNNGVKLLKDLRSVIGPKPAFAGPDGWTPYSATLGAGSAAQDMYVSYAGLPLRSSARPGRSSSPGQVRESSSARLPPYAVYQGQTAQIMLDAISRSDGTRASVTSELFKAHVKNGIMGTFHFDKNGDTVPLKAISFDQLVEDRRLRVRGHHQGLRAKARRSESELGKGRGPFPSRSEPG